MRKLLCCSMVLTFVTLVAIQVHAAVPTFVPLQGELSDDDGVPIG